MNASRGAPMALGFILAIPFFALPALGAPAREIGHKPHHRVADFAEARAYVSPTAPVAQTRKPTASAARMRNATSAASTTNGPKPAGRLTTRSAAPCLRPVTAQPNRKFIFSALERALKQ